MRFCILSIILFVPIIILANTEHRTFVNLLDYIANDYVNAVEDGQIINEFEYNEMLEFSATLSALDEQFSTNDTSQIPSFATNIAALDTAIKSLENPPVIAQICATIKDDFMSLGLISSAPNTWPDIINGAQLYELNCKNCHGAEGLGNGVLAENMDPMPTNFTDASHLTPFHIFNTTTLGIEGTSMAPFTHLSDQEKWDLAFYVQTLNIPFDGNVDHSLFPAAASKAPIDKVATLNNEALKALLGNDEAAFTSLRFHTLGNQFDQAIQYTKHLLNDARLLYFKGDIDGANQKALQAYFDGFEPLERKLGATHPQLVRTIEGNMLQFRAAINDDPKGIEVDNSYEALLINLESAQQKNSADESSFMFVFLAALSILIREGLEALLIIIAILAALRAFGNTAAQKYVHGGWIFAVLLGVIGYFFVGQLIALGAQKREVLEGLGALLAVLILLSVGFWLHDKSNAQRWNKYIQKKVGKHLSTNSLYAIGLLSFVVVFREAFESVIFLSSLTLSGDSTSNMAVLSALILASFAIVLIAILLIRYSKKLPINLVFKISAITMVILAVILAGKGIKELQEAGWVGVDLLPFNLSFDLFGFYPTVQTVGAQLITLVIVIALIAINKMRAKQA